MTEHLGCGHVPSQQQVGGSVTSVRVGLDGSSTTLSEEALEQQEAAPSSRSFIVTTGSAMLDQFVPWYFGVAFAFVFKYCAGVPDMPEWCSQPRYRRTLNAPRVELPLWVRVVSRRVESQLRRDGIRVTHLEIYSSVQLLI